MPDPNLILLDISREVVAIGDNWNDDCTADSIPIGRFIRWAFALNEGGLDTAILQDVRWNQFTL